jgi:PTS system nitrogen regulatory IIA component
MMSFYDFIDSNRIMIDNSSQSKTAVLFRISQMIHQILPQLSEEFLFDAYWRRETLGSTAIGHGVIIPHIRSEQVFSITGCFIKLEHPVDFGAVDKQDVDLVIGLIVPQQQVRQHLNTLAFISEQFSNPLLRKSCREALTAERLFDCLKSFNNPLLQHQHAHEAMESCTL